MKTLKTMYWVTGNKNNGFRVVTTKPRTKFIREPFDTFEAAERHIVMIWSDLAE